MADPNPVATPSATELEKTINDVRTDQALSDPKIPLELKLETGQVYKGETPQDLLDQLTKAQEHSSREIKRQRDEIEVLRQGQQRQPEQAQPSPDAYDVNEYYRQWQTDPRAAQEYLDRFNPQVQATRATIAQQQQMAEIEKFKSNVGGWQAQDKAEADAFIGEFQRSGLQPTAASYELVYRRMADENRISRAGISHIEGQQAPPPRATSFSSGGSNFDMDRFASLPADQQLKVIENLEKQGFRR